MIHVAIGTKAQFIKMAPIMRALQARGVAYNLIDLGQHALITRNLRQEFSVKPPDAVLAGGDNVASLGQGFRWIAALTAQGLNRRRLREEVFRGRSGVCLVHGDTASTLAAVLLAKRAGLKVAHVEAGLRSHHPLEPFPEELVRLAAMRLSDILFAPSRWAQSNLVRMGLGARCIPLSANTSMEALAYSLSMPAPRAEEGGPYALVTVHRMENIFSRQRLGMVLDLVAHISRRMKVVFVQHQPTINRLKRYGLQRRLEGIAGLRLHRIMSHRDFLHLLEGCEFVVTDGGSIQEESACLGKPCLLLRRRTERQDGLGQNVAIGGCDLEAGLRFLEEFPRLRRPPARMPEIRPSEQIVAYLSSATPWD